MNVVVTGAAGFIGSHLCEALLQGGHTVVGIDAFTKNYDRAIKDANLTRSNRSARFRLIEADLRTDALAPCIPEGAALIHAAAMPGLGPSWVDFATYMSCNLLATQRLLEAARKAEVRRFVHISTSSVYGAFAVGDERRPTRPISPYGVTKLAAEHLVQAYVEAYDLPALILRYFSVYGPRQRPDMAYHIFIDRLLHNQPITVFGDGRQSRSNTFVSDCVRGTVQAMEAGTVGEVYNIGGGVSLTVNDAIALLAQELAVEPLLSYSATQLGDQRETAADTSKAERAFGFEATITPAEGLRAQIDWQRATSRGHSAVERVAYTAAAKSVPASRVSGSNNA